jgi:hypothetical protein
MRDMYHKSVEAYLPTQNIHITTRLIEGQHPDIIDKKAPPRPKQHKMQGDLTPAELEWCLRYAPVEFENRLGVKLRELEKGEEKPTDPRDMWVRANVVRIVNQPVEGTNGGEYLSVKFTAKDQIIARRASHITFTEKEIYKERKDPITGKLVEELVDPYDNVYAHDVLQEMERKGDIKILWKRPGAASAGSIF